MNEASFEPLRLALVGCGGIGWRHALAAAEMQRRGRGPVRYVAVCDFDARRREEIAGQLEALTGERPRALATLDDALDNAVVEAVDICLPTFLHRETTLQALAAGRHVQVEKPLALTVRDCDEIIEAARMSGLVVSVAENYRRIPGNRAFAALLASGELGQPEALFVRNLASSTPAMIAGGRSIDPPVWYHDRRRAGGYHALEMGVHEADLQRLWFGDVVAVSATTGVFRANIADPHRGEDVLTATFQFASGFQSHLWFCSAPAAVERADRLLVGERGSCSSEAWHAWQGGTAFLSGDHQIAWIDLVRTWLAALDPVTLEHILPAGSWDETALHSSPEAPLSYGIGTALFDFARAVRTKSRPEIGVEDGRAAVAICMAILESARAGAEVPIADIAEPRGQA